MLWTCNYLIAGVNKWSRHRQVCTNLFKSKSSSKWLLDANGKTSKHLLAVWSSIWQWALSLCFSLTNPFGSQTGISPFLQPPQWNLRPLNYKLLWGLFRGITRLRIEDNSKEKIQRDLTQNNRDQMRLFGSCKAGSWYGGLERMLYSHHNSAFIGRKCWHIFMAHLWFKTPLKQEPLR